MVHGGCVRRRMSIVAGVYTDIFSRSRRALGYVSSIFWGGLYAAAVAVRVAIVLIFSGDDVPARCRDVHVFGQAVPISGKEKRPPSHRTFSPYPPACAIFPFDAVLSLSFLS